MKQSVYIIQCPPVWIKTPPLSLVHLKTYSDTTKFILANKDTIPKIAQVNPYVDYMGDSQGHLPAEESLSRVGLFLEMIEKEKIRYTKSFINNLVY